MTSPMPSSALLPEETRKLLKPGRWPLHNWRISVGSLIASLVIGTLLTFINQGEAVFGGDPALQLAWVIPINYVMALILVKFSGALAEVGA